MNIESAASALKELGHQTRLAIYKELVKAGLTGMSVGELQKRALLQIVGGDKLIIPFC